MSAVRMSGTRARLTLAAPLPVDIGVDAELGWSLLSRRRLHDLRHSSASITGNLYVHMLRSSGQKTAEAVAAVVPAPRAAGTKWAPNPRRGSFRLTRARFPLVAQGSARGDHGGG
ncbi:hypothetical protein [Frankia gtarii]|uniref:hypothetical protein n=1 Tax=Frankia gtarii TaxID=2950102 RepID=UPI0021C14153|nr:hypothetical protein [Frankia gtarii]